MRISRPCYDKAHRCPGWAGGGPHFAKVDRCDNGRIRAVRWSGKPLVDDPESDPVGEWSHPGAHPWHPGRCNVCDVVTIPRALTRLAPSEIRWRVYMWRSNRANRKYWRG